MAVLKLRLAAERALQRGRFGHQLLAEGRSQGLEAAVLVHDVQGHVHAVLLLELVEEGLAKAQEEAADSIRAANEKAQRTMETAREEMRIYLHQAEKDVTDIALHVVEKILPQHFIDVPQVILPLVRQALRKVQDQAQVIVHTAPDAYELVLMAQPEFQSMLEGNATLSVVSDDSLQMGDCILETPNGNVDARLATQLELIKQAVQDVRL